MTLTNLLVLLGGLALMVGIAWFFWGPRKSGQRAALTSSGYQEAMRFWEECPSTNRRDRAGRISAGAARRV